MDIAYTKGDTYNFILQFDKENNIIFLIHLYSNTTVWIDKRNSSIEIFHSLSLFKGVNKNDRLKQFQYNYVTFNCNDIYSKHCALFVGNFTPFKEGFTLKNLVKPRERWVNNYLLSTLYYGGYRFYAFISLSIFRVFWFW